MVRKSSPTSFTVSENEPKPKSRFKESSVTSTTIITFFVLLCLGNTCQLMISSIFKGTLSTLERRFSYSTTISAVIMTSDLVIFALFSPIVGYYANHFNRVRVIAIGSVTFGIASLISTLPFFIYGAQDSGGAGSSSGDHHYLNSTLSAVVGSSSPSASFDLCPSSLSCSAAEGGLTGGNTVWLAVLMLFLGRFFTGIGILVYYVVAMPLVDDLVGSESSPLYISCMHGINLVGRLLGYFLSAYTLTFSENPFEPSGLDPSDVRFIGAWWLGYFIAGILVLITSIPLFFFPAELGKSLAAVENSVELNSKGGGSSFMASFKRFIRNPLLVLFFLGNEFRYIGINGFYAFKAKYIEAVYRTTAAQASLITGATGFMPISVGLIIGGLYISYCKPKTRLLFTLVFFAELVSVATIGSGLFLACEPVNMAGTVSGDGGFSLDSSCNQNCHCSSTAFNPLCAPDGKTTYFSPCHASCRSFNESTNTFGDCDCFIENLPATSGYCAVDTSCSHLSTWLILLTLGTLISATAKTGNSLITFRACSPEDKSFTNGILSSLISIFGFMPCELSYGYIVDFTCLVWDSKCGQTGNCWLYEQDKLRVVFIGVSAAFMAVGSLFDLIIIFYSNRMKNLYGDEK